MNKSQFGLEGNPLGTRLEFYRFVSPSGSATCAGRMVNADGVSVQVSTITISTAAKSIGDLIDDITGGNFDRDQWVGFIPETITGGPIYYLASSTNDDSKTPAVEVSATHNDGIVTVGKGIGVVPPSEAGGAATASNQLAAIRGTSTTTTPNFASASSVTLLAANASRTYVEIQNNSGANIAINPEGATLTGIVPTSTNKCIVIVPGGTWYPEGPCPVGAITGYQTSGATVNTVTVLEIQ